MLDTPVISRPLITWGVASRPLPGSGVSGDLHWVKPLPNGVLMAAVDGIGHGEEAAFAARRAVEVLENSAAGLLRLLVHSCHEALVKTRGVVMTLAHLDASVGALTWLGVGNVEALLVRADLAAKPSMDRVVLRSGLVGYHLPELRESVLSIAPGDLLVFATDGIGPGFTRGWHRGWPPQEIADHILDQHFRGTDDALVLVVRYIAPGGE